MLKIAVCDKNRISLYDMFFGFYIFSQTCCSSSIFGNLSLLLFVGVILFFNRRRLMISQYTWCEIIFVFYCVLHIFLGVTVLNAVAWDDLTSVIAISLVNIALYIYIIRKDNVEQVLSVYIWAAFFAFLIILLLYGTDMAARAGSESYSVTIMGIKISGGVATKIGMGAAIAYFLSMYRYYKKSSFRLYLCCGLFFIVAAFSGTRKILLIVFMATILIPILKEKKISKKMKYLLLDVLIVIAIYIAVMNIPVLYDTIGYRLVKLQNYFLYGTGDNSSVTRSNLLIEAKNAFLQKPLLGWGLENFRQLFDGGRYHCHNNYWEMLVAGGVIGFVIFYSKYVLIFLKFSKAYRKNKKNKIKNTLFVSVLLILFVSMVVLEYWQRTYNQRNMAIVYMLIFAYLQREIRKRVVQ